MCTIKNYLKLALEGLLLFLIVMSHYEDLFAQYFPLGIFNYDVRGREYRLSQSNETALIINLNANYLSEMSPRAQNDLIVFSDTLSTRVFRTDVIYDSVCWNTHNYYPLISPTNEPYNDRLDRYISENQNPANIHYADIRRFVHCVDSIYGSHSGVGTIRIAHQGWMDSTTHWPYIRRAGYLIQQYFGDNVKSVAINNTIHWSRSQLQDFFSNDPPGIGVGDSLDVYQHEYYPFYDASNPAGPAYMGDAFQNLLDERFIASCELTRLALNASGNTHTTLEMFIQAHRQFDGTNYSRRPTQAEIWLQAFLALGRGFKGIHVYCYRTVPPGQGWYPDTTWYDSGLVTIDLSRLPINIPTNNQPYNNVAQLFAHLSSLGPQVLPLEVDTAFTWTGSVPPDYPLIQGITGYALDGSHHTIEVSLMDHPSNNYDYFLLINRRCSSDNNGTPAPAQTITVRTNKTGQYQIQDLYSGELFVSSDGCFRNITIGPGRGRVFELRPIFVLSTETWDTDTVNVSSNITVPTGKTLTITANNKVKFYSGTELKVQGTLYANGVMFTAAVANANPGYWSRIYFYYASASSQIQHSTIEKANYGIFCDHASPTIDTTVVNLNNYGIYCQSSSSPYITENYITDNYSYGIYLTQTCNPYIRKNAIRYNWNNGVQCLNSSSPSLIGKSTSEPYGANEIILNEGHGVRAQTNSNPNIGTVFSGSLRGYNDIYSNYGKQVSNYTAGITINANVN